MATKDKPESRGGGSATGRGGTASSASRSKTHPDETYVDGKRGIMRAGNFIEINYKNQNDAHFMDPDSATKLYVGTSVDTSDRSMLRTSEGVRFDPVGFRRKKPLLRDIFYTDPYITCRNCNLLNFVDVVTIRRMLTLPDVVSRDLQLRPEVLPPCTACERADCFFIGSHDFAAEVAERRRAAEELARRERLGAEVIQRAYRRYLRLMYGSALCNLFLADKYVKLKAATKITSAARGRLGRRVAITRRALKIIFKAHPLLVRHSLRSQLRGPKVFWYKRQAELDILFDDYLELVRKLGFLPPRKTVEDNIQEIARRVRARQNTLIVLVQRRWRGFMSKRIVKYFRTEISRLFQFRVARAMKIQRAYRGHYIRLQLPRLHYERQRGQNMDEYKDFAKEAGILQQRWRSADVVLGLYQVQRREEKTCRYTSRIAQPKHHDMKKMAAFWDSPYVDERLAVQERRLLKLDGSMGSGEGAAIERDQERKRFIERRIAESGPVGVGYRGVPMQKVPRDFYFDQALTYQDLGLRDPPKGGINISDELFMNTLRAGQAMAKASSARSRAFSSYFVAELVEIAASLVERLSSNHSKKGLASRFKAFNDKRLGSLKITDGKGSGNGSSNGSGKSKVVKASSPPAPPAPVPAPAPDPMASYLLEREKIRAKLTGKPAPTTAPMSVSLIKIEEGDSDDSPHSPKSPYSPKGKVRLPEVKGALVASPSKPPLPQAALGRDALAQDDTRAERRHKLAAHRVGDFRFPQSIYFDAEEWLYKDFDVVEK